jgi:hypothetical protein
MLLKEEKREMQGTYLDHFYPVPAKHWLPSPTLGRHQLEALTSGLKRREQLHGTLAFAGPSSNVKKLSVNLRPFSVS